MWNKQSAAHSRTCTSWLRTFAVLYHISLYWHCHQRQERSFFLKGRQFPLCARCTGMLIGPALFPLFLWRFSWTVPVVLLVAFSTDTLSQFLGLRSSNNTLRFATGMGFSIALLGLLFGAAKWLLNITA
jgi:uncharacterized membrane protein